MSDGQLAIFLTDNRSAFRPGEALHGSVLWALTKEPRALEIRLFWRTQGKGSDDVGIVESHVVTAPAIAGEQAFDFTLPRGPWSFSGKLISLCWGVEVVVEPNGQNARCAFVLGPDAREILLSDYADVARL